MLEGCYYLFPDAAATWEAGYSLLATGTEDYFESAFYFDAGVYAQPYTGVTLREGADEELSRISAYKIHGSHDPMVFSDGFTLKWRNGGSVRILLPPRIVQCNPPISHSPSRPLVLCFRIRTPAVCMVLLPPPPPFGAAQTCKIRRDSSAGARRARRPAAPRSAIRSRRM